MRIQGSARGKLEKKTKGTKDKKSGTDPFYASYLAVRSEPVAVFLGRVDPKWVLPITSVNEVSDSSTQLSSHCHTLT